MTVDYVLVAVSYNNNDVLPDLARSLINQTCGAWRCIIADNGDRQSAAEVVSDFDSRIQVLRFGENLGYLRAAERVLGTQPLMESAPRFIIVMNADVTLAPDFLETLGAVIQENALLIAPSIVSSRDGHDLNPFMRRRPSRRRTALRTALFLSPTVAQVAIIMSYLARQFSWSRSPKSGTRELIYASHGSVIVLAREFFVRGGTLSGGSFLFGEEVFLAEQCVRLSGTVLYEPRIRCTHVEHASTGLLRSRKVLRWQREATWRTLVAIMRSNGRQSSPADRRHRSTC